MKDNIVLLLKKNFKHELRSWIYFLLEMVVIIILIIALYPFDDGSKLDFKPDLTKTKIHENVAELDKLKHFRNYRIFYTPTDNLIEGIIKGVAQKLELKDAQGFANKQEMLKQFNADNVMAALTFNEITNTTLDLSIHFPSKFRSEKCDGIDCYWLSRCRGVFELNDDVGNTTASPNDIYEHEGFLPLQHQIFKEWIKSSNSSKYEMIPAINVNSFAHETNDVETCLQRPFNKYTRFLYNFIFFIPFLNMLWRISREIEEDLPRHFSNYGFSKNQHWIAYFVTAFLHLFILDIILIRFLMIELPNTPDSSIIYRYGYLLLFLIFYNIILSLNMLILAILIANAKTATLLGSSLWMVSYGICSTFLENAAAVDAHVVMSLLIFPNNFLPFGLAYFGHDLGIWIMFALQVGAIALYIITLKAVERLRIRRLNGGHCWTKKNDKKKNNSETILSDDINWSSFEYGPVEGHQLVLKNVYVFQDYRGAEKQILKNISMKVFKNEISIILGTRSCGKSTLIAVLAGWLNYTGQIYFEDNQEITENWKHYRRFLDLMFMSTNALCDLFSVEEQLHYIIIIKYQDANKTHQRLEVSKWLTLLKPYISDPGVFVKALNFDQKRLLALCCILIGNSRIVLLDEPTRHMTADGRSAYWHILKQEKPNRVIVMTTDSVDEANAIGDRIGILYRGSLMAWGTSFHLRSNLSDVVHMIVFITPMSAVEPITQLMEKYLTNLVIKNQFHDRIIYILPANKKTMYQRMLLDLEREFNTLGIRNIYMSSGDLYDVYLNLTTQKDKKLPPANHISESLKVVKETTPLSRSTQVQQIIALYYKKLLYQAPNIVPIAIMMFGVILIPIIAEMFNHFYGKNPSIQMVAVPNTESDIKTIHGLEQSNYSEIKSVYNKYLQYQSRYLSIGSLSTAQHTYNDSLQNDTAIFTKFGAIERIKGGSKISNIWINEKIFHSAALILNLAHYSIFANLYPNNTDMLINIYNEPIWVPTEEKISLNHISNLPLPLTMGIIMPLTICAFIVTLIDERQHHIDILQRIAGATTTHLWFTHFMWDYMVYWMLAMLYFVLLCIYTIEGFMVTSKLLILILLGFYGIASLFWVYVMFLLVRDHKLSGFLMIFLLQIILGYVGFLVYRQVADDEEPFWFFFLMLSPTFALLMGMATVSAENDVRALCHSLCGGTNECNERNSCSLVSQCCYASFFQWSFPGILPSICFMLLTTVILAAIFIGITFCRNRKKYSTTDRIKQMSSVCYPYDMECVIDEKVRISNMNVKTCKGYAVLVDQLEYEIPKKENRVRAISFALEYSKCMGVYGPFASGKSHLIKQLIGEKPIRFGEVYICGNECKTKIREALRNLGYCPQNNGFIEGATPRQLFTLFLMINGVPASKRYSQLRDLSLTLNLRRHMNSRISELPLNIRRRVNIAIALILQNKVLIFDEPTRGMPPSEKYLIWSIIRQARDHGNSIIISSQDSMELEELTDFIIMIDQGEMLAIGSVHSIRKIYTMGLYLEIKLYSDGKTLEEMENNLLKDIENLQRFITFLHGNAELVTRNGNVLKFYLPIASILYSYLFGSMEKNRQRLNIAEYLVSQGTLEIAYENLRNARKQKIRYESTNLMV